MNDDSEHQTVNDDFECQEYNSKRHNCGEMVALNA